MKTFTMTGHRPNKLGGYGDSVQDSLIDVCCEYFRENKPDRMVDGLAPGFDWAAIIAAHRMNIPHIIGAIPCVGQDAPWPPNARIAYQHIISLCTEIKMVHNGPYNKNVMQDRNIWMLDQLIDGLDDKLISLWNGTTGGTANCINAAIERGIPHVNLYQRWIQTRSVKNLNS